MKSSSGAAGRRPEGRVEERAPGEKPGELAYGIALFVTAFAVRMRVALSLAAEPVWDGHYYDFGAKRIAEGQGYSDEIAGHWHPWCHYPVGYSAYLGAFYKLFGTASWVAHVADAFAGGMLAVVAFLLAREALSPARSKLAGILVAFHPGLVLYGALLMTEPLSALLVLGAFWVALVVGRRHADEGWWYGPAAGALVLGIAALVRPQALMCAPFLALAVRSPSPAKVDAKSPSPEKVALGSPSPEKVALGSPSPEKVALGSPSPEKVALGSPSPEEVALGSPSPEKVDRGAPWKTRAIAAVLGCAVALVPVLPWTARNCRVMDGCALVSTNAGWNLAIGAFPRATGRFETLRSSDGCREVTGQVQQDRCWLEYGLGEIRQHPLHWLSLAPAKLAYTFDHESFAVEYLREARPGMWPEERRVLVRKITTAVHRFFMFAAVLGLLAWSRRQRWAAALLAGAAYAAFTVDNPIFWPLVVVLSVLPWIPFRGRPAAEPALLMGVGLLATTALAHVLFFGEDRYHVVVTPVLCILAAAAFRKPYEARPQRAQNAHGATPEVSAPRV